MSMKYQALSHLHLSLLNALALEGVDVKPDGGEWSIRLPPPGLPNLFDLSIGFWKLPDPQPEKFCGIPVVIDDALKDGEFRILKGHRPESAFDALRALRQRPGRELYSLRCPVDFSVGGNFGMAPRRDANEVKFDWGSEPPVVNEGVTASFTVGGVEGTLKWLNDAYIPIRTNASGLPARFLVPEGAKYVDMALPPAPYRNEMFAKEVYERTAEGQVIKTGVAVSQIPEWVQQFDKEHAPKEKPFDATPLPPGYMWAQKYWNDHYGNDIGFWLRCGWTVTEMVEKLVLVKDPYHATLESDMVTGEFRFGLSATDETLHWSRTVLHQPNAGGSVKVTPNIRRLLAELEDAIVAASPAKVD